MTSVLSAKGAAMSRMKALLIPAVLALALGVLAPSLPTAEPAAAQGPYYQPTVITNRIFPPIHHSHVNGLELLYLSSLMPDYVPVPGDYCSDQSGGEIFVPTGIQPAAGLTCPAATPGTSGSTS